MHWESLHSHNVVDKSEQACSENEMHKNFHFRTKQQQKEQLNHDAEAEMKFWISHKAQYKFLYNSFFKLPLTLAK